MDHIRKELDQLMGKDRNLPLSRRGKRKEHFDEPNVCKYFLVAFCPHDLFPNTKADIGRCPKRHDEYFKKLYEKDPNKDVYQRRYEDDLMEFLEKIIAQLDGKIRRTLAKIDIPADADQPKEIKEKIESLHKKINFFLDQAERLGEEGKLEESEAIMKEIERLKMQKAELATMSENPLLQTEKQMHVCEVCGAMQSLTDTEKRLTIHLEGKLHTGYALIRKTLGEIKQRREEARRAREKDGSRSQSGPPTCGSDVGDKRDSTPQSYGKREASTSKTRGRSRSRSRNRSRSRSRHNTHKNNEESMVVVEMMHRTYKIRGNQSDRTRGRDRFDHRDHRNDRPRRRDN